jgi:isopentenyl diphosphate isomerase/L-lactate dehydrogenase-like FMN-dependent dehydrogenase
LKLPDAHSIDALRTLAQRRLPRGVLDFFDGGADDELSLRESRRTIFSRQKEAWS